jgi:ATP-dependent protease ClpP protease subunit
LRIDLVKFALMKSHHIYIDDVITSEVDAFGTPKGISARMVRNEIAKARANGAEKFILHISSPGGIVFEGFEIYNLLTGTGLPIDAYVESLSASIATLIMLAGEDRNTVFMTPTSQIMTHKPHTQTQGSSDDHKNTVEELEKIEQLMAERYAHKIAATLGTPYDIEKGHALMSEGDRFINPSEAVAIGLCDVVQSAIAAVSQKHFAAYMESKKTNPENKMKKNPLILALLAEVSAMFASDRSQFKAEAAKLADGNTTIYAEGAIEVGKEVFTDEAMTTKAPEGEHALEDGRIIVVDAAGVVVEVREVEASTDAELQAENEALTAENETLRSENATLQASIVDLKKSFDAKLATYETKLTALKAAITTDGKLPKGVAVSKSNEGSSIATKSTASAFAERMRAKGK